MFTQLPPETRKVLEEGAPAPSIYCGQCGAVNAGDNRFYKIAHTLVVCAA